MSSYDVVVVGAGNAVLSAAIAARANGARVLILEKTSEEEKGVSSYFPAGGFRFCHSGIDDVCREVLVNLSPAELGLRSAARRDGDRRRPAVQ